MLKTILRQRRYLWTTAIVFTLYVLLYLFVTQFIVFTAAGTHEPFAIDVVSNWTEQVFRQRSTFLYESIAVIHVTPYVSIFLSIPNLILAFLLSVLVGLNIAVSYYIFRKVGWRGKEGVASLVGTIPALLGGAACCVPTLIIVLGIQFTAALSTVWSFFVPLSFILLIGSLVWALHQATRNPAICRNPKK